MFSRSFSRILDNLPVAIAKVRDDNGMPFKTYERGWPVGRIEASFFPFLVSPTEVP